MIVLILNINLLNLLFLNNMLSIFEAYEHEAFKYINTFLIGKI